MPERGSRGPAVLMLAFALALTAGAANAGPVPVAAGCAAVHQGSEICWADRNRDGYPDALVVLGPTFHRSRAEIHVVDLRGAPRITHFGGSASFPVLDGVTWTAGSDSRHVWGERGVSRELNVHAALSLAPLLDVEARVVAHDPDRDGYLSAGWTQLDTTTFGNRQGFHFALIDHGFPNGWVDSWQLCTGGAYTGPPRCIYEPLPIA